MQLKVHYYALLREQAGRSEETIETAAATASGFTDAMTRVIKPPMDVPTKTARGMPKDAMSPRTSKA